MKKIMTLSIAALFATFASKAATNLDWGNANYVGNNGAQDIVDQAGNPLGSSFVATILLVSSGDNIIGWNPVTQTIGAGETTLVTWNWTANWNDNQVDGYLFRALATPTDPIGPVGNGTFLYTVIYTPTASLILDGATAGAAVVGANQIGTYDTTGNGGGANPNQWVVVPEPSTYAFMGLGAVLLAVRRLRRS